jgi:hypothetical protein
MNYCRQFSHYVTPSQTVVEIADQGLGFDPKTIADPVAPENLERPSGRGLFLIRYYMTSVRFNECGNHLTLYKNNSNSTCAKAAAPSTSYSEQPVGRRSAATPWLDSQGLRYFASAGTRFYRLN